MRTATFRRIAAAGVALAACAAPATPAGAQQGDDRCLTADPPPITRPAEPIRFGIAPRAAGSAGATQGSVAPEDEGAALAALRDLRPPGRALVMRLNRLFWSDGEAGLRRFGALADHYAAAGFQVESQVRYHPPEGREGDIAAWEDYVRAAVRELGRRPAVVELSITNEGNLPASGNTSDGGYEGIHEAIVRGVVAARRQADAIGRPDLRIGFSVMWRWWPDSDARFWRRIGELADATPGFRTALDHVGLQVYPGLVWPPAPLPDRTAGREVVEALTLMRGCYLPKAGLGREIDLWVTENGYATNLGRTEARQVEDLESTVRDLHRWSGELGVTDYRWFNLRDNDSDGGDLFSAVGLLRDDYTRKPAFPAFRALIAQYGAAAGGSAGGAPAAPTARQRRRPRVAALMLRSGSRLAVWGRVLTGSGLDRRAACRGTVVVGVRRGGRTLAARAVRVDRACRFRAATSMRRRGVRVVVRFGGNALLRPAAAPARRRPSVPSMAAAATPSR